MSPQPGARLGPYEIVEAIGAGGMGEVYRARAAAALNHPNILAVYDIGTDSTTNSSYIVSELLDGQTLREAFAHSGRPVRKAAEYTSTFTAWRDRSSSDCSAR